MSSRRRVPHLTKVASADDSTVDASGRLRSGVHVHGNNEGGLIQRFSANGPERGRRGSHGTGAFQLSFKVMLIGDSGVGKTCFLMRFKDGAFLAGNYIATVGIDFKNKIVLVDDTKVRLQVWDTAGQERFRSVTHAYYRDADALLLFYDVSNKASFDNVRAWLTEIDAYADKDVVVMLIANKADIPSRAVSKADGETLAKDCKVPFLETSAKSGHNVELAFMALAKDLRHKEMAELNKPKFTLQEYVTTEENKSSCCFS
uniref:ras-related protein Rab-37-like isoform X1 n=2 Tax=Myxine glutinosa TaxID=7769 RepID=UPI00358EBD64